MGREAHQEGDARSAVSETLAVRYPILPLGLLVAACGASGARARDTSDEAPAIPESAEETTAATEPAPEAWAERTLGPTVTAAADLPWLACRRDPSLERAAAYLAERRAKGKKAPTARGLELTLRRFGSPLPSPQASVLSGKALRDEDLRARIHISPEARCGLRDATAPNGERTVVLVAAESHAVLEPIPTRARVGQFLTLRATTDPGIRSVRVYLTAAGGNVHTTPVSTDSTGAFVARFAVDAPGMVTAQVVADLADGPRPVLEALVFAGLEPQDPNDEAADPVPASADLGDGSLYQWLAQARGGSPPLTRDERLEAIARTHAERMRGKRVAAHDAGDGLPTDRVARLGVREVGENVAHARSLREAHAALLESPSHRANVLSNRFTHVGIGVARDADGSFWVTQLFTSPLERP